MSRSVGVHPTILVGGGFCFLVTRIFDVCFCGVEGLLWVWHLLSILKVFWCGVHCLTRHGFFTIEAKSIERVERASNVGGPR